MSGTISSHGRVNLVRRGVPAYRRSVFAAQTAHCGYEDGVLYTGRQASINRNPPEGSIGENASTVGSAWNTSLLWLPSDADSTYEAPLLDRGGESDSSKGLVLRISSISVRSLLLHS